MADAPAVETEETPIEEQEAPEAQPEAADVPPAEESPGEARTPEQVTRWNQFLHIGEGAEECPDGENGRCKNSAHFHAFCRLPNPLQIKEIRDKANAAKARCIRQLRDPESDRHLILDTDMVTLREVAEKDALVAEVLGRTRFQENFAATREVASREEFETIEEDQRRFEALDKADPEQRDEDEYNELVRHLQSWTDAVKAELEERQRPERESLEALSQDELVEQIREERIKAEAQEAWMEAYSLWEWYLGTLQPRDPDKGIPIERVYGSIEQMKVAPREHVEAIERAFQWLEGGDLSPRSQTTVSAEGNS